MGITDNPDEDVKTSGWRGSRELWLRAAKRAFLDTGLDAVKIQPLASSLNISRTSFYWFFKDRNALLDALLEEWEAKNTGAFIDACNAYAETPAEAVLNLIGVFLDETVFEPRLDFAVRGWAHQSAPVMARVNAADERRLAAIRAMFDRFGYPADEADTRARTVYLTQIGYISMQVRESLPTRMARIPRYVEIFSGHAPLPGELARFHARHGYSPRESGADLPAGKA
ncbi:TetR/AcrR family transcriptional regulator [Paracoccus methylarcula]|uniref:TetR/AcrR family transcriptional regulator n=1 Tax=Paracoccus methylarcula TaxID=72022 RepID=A0A3R7Q211_9RHOB|nr:TetR/AcrR family transcriptional regulator [Paracoccus methylarcula]RNF34074.1 TetR/AcrR family transcriptional regulator [Paracoccus methylarcula]